MIDAEPLDDAVAAAVAVLRRGGTVVLPTDTVYGIAALPSDPAAVQRIFELKQRPDGMHVAVLLSGPEQLELVSTAVGDVANRLAERFWPGALTLVLGGATEAVARLGDGDGTVGVRCPDHPLVRAIAREVGPLATTSANRHGHPTPDTAAGVARQLPGADLVIDGGVCAGGVASTVVSLVHGSPEILREGPVTAAEISDSVGAPPPDAG